MDLNNLWFVLIGILFAGYFVLEGYDFGVGILLPVLGRNDTDRRVMINAIGPHWGGSQVWLITAGGAMFAAFPGWYAALFSGFYLPLLLILVALILRGVAIEFRSKDDHPRWKAACDWAIFGGSLVPALLWGVAFANFVRGVPVDASGYYTGGFWNLLNPFALLGGLVSLTGFITHGAVFLTLRTTGTLEERARQWAFRAWIPACLVLVAYTIAAYFETDILTKLGVNPGPVPICSVVSLLVAGWFIRQRRDGWSFIMTSLAILLAIATLFMQLHPRVLISSLDPAWSLTIYSAASGAITLKTMTVVALIFLPVILGYIGWSYWIFRKPVTGNPHDLHY
jgi:cytochrome d ubiquinol oxidase subunit II